VPELFLAKINCSTLWKFLVSQLKKVMEIFPIQEVNPMKVCLIILLSNVLAAYQLLNTVGLAGLGRLWAPGAAVYPAEAFQPFSLTYYLNQS
jgi:hypothetical protein